MTKKSPGIGFFDPEPGSGIGCLAIRNLGRPRPPMAAAVTKLGTRPAPPPRLKTRSNREPTPTHNSHNTQHTRVNQNTLRFMQKGLEETSHQTRSKIDASDASLLLGSINYTRLVSLDQRSKIKKSYLFWLY